MSNQPTPTPERTAELFSKLPARTGYPFGNDEQMRAAQVLRALLLEFGIYGGEVRGIAMTLARICG